MRTVPSRCRVAGSKHAISFDSFEIDERDPAEIGIDILISAFIIPTLPCQRAQQFRKPKNP